MALNLRKKIPESDTLTIFDVNTNSTKKFLDEAGGKGVHIASDPKEVAQNSVRRILSVVSPVYDDRIVLSMI